MSLLAVAGANSASGGYDVDNSLKIEGDNTERLYFTPSANSTGNQRTFTISCWVKRTEISSDLIMNIIGAGFDNEDKDSGFRFHSDEFRFAVFGSPINTDIRTNALFRDTSAWYHIVIGFDSTQSTNTNRVKLYVNGNQVTDLKTSTYPSQNLQTRWGENGKTMMIGNRPGNSANSHAGSTQYFNGYIAEAYFVDGQQLQASDFGEFDDDTGIWKPIQYTGSFGNNGWYLDFKNSSNLGEDQSGNNNDFSANNISSADQATDTPTNNFAILNTRHRVPDTTRKEGATATVKNNNGWRTLVSTLGVSSGKWYFELSAGSEYTMIGVSGDGVYGSGSTYEYYVGSLTGSLGYYGNSATFYQDGVDKSPTNVSSFVADDIIGLALDVDNGKAYFHKNGTYQNSANPNTSSNGYTITGDAPYFLTMSTYQQSDQCEVNYGGYHVYSISSGNSDANGYGNFEYAVPSGYYALCTKNLAEYG